MGKHGFFHSDLSDLNSWITHRTSLRYTLHLTQSLHVICTHADYRMVTKGSTRPKQGWEFKEAFLETDSWCRCRESHCRWLGKTVKNLLQRSYNRCRVERGLQGGVRCRAPERSWKQGAGPGPDWCKDRWTAKQMGCIVRWVLSHANPPPETVRNFLPVCQSSPHREVGGQVGEAIAISVFGILFTGSRWGCCVLSLSGILEKFLGGPEFSGMVCTHVPICASLLW